MKDYPITFTWEGEAMVPLPRFARRCDKEFVVGEKYPLVVDEKRSTVSHRHFFASVNEGWKNLPEDLALRFPSPDHLRKWALCKAGYADERTIVCSSPAQAQMIAVWVRPLNGFAVIVVKDATVSVFTAKSQSVQAMGKEEFQKSKTAVLDIISDMIGVDRDTLSANAGRAA